MDIACWDTAQKCWVAFGLECKYDVGGMKSGGSQRGGLMHRVCILVQAWRLGVEN